MRGREASRRLGGPTARSCETVSLPLRRLARLSKLFLGGALACVLFTSYVGWSLTSLGGLLPWNADSFEKWHTGPGVRPPSQPGLANGRAEARALAAGSGGGTGATGHGEEKGTGAPASSLEGTLCFIIVCFVIACALDHWNMILPESLQFPISVLLFIVGMVVGIIFLWGLEGSGWKGAGFDTFIEGMKGASHIDPHALFHILLPPLLYESASSMSWRVLRKVLVSAVILALPGVILNTILTACFAKVTFRIGDDAFGWEASLLLASILSATDPVAVVASLAALGAPKKLATLIEGESLLNDGSAVVFFFVFLDMVASKAPDSMKQCQGVPPSPSCVILYFFKLALGGPAIGMAIGLVLFLWIGWAQTHNSEVLEIAIVITAVYGTFFLAESLHVSGVLAVVALGMVFTFKVHSRMSHGGRHAHHVVFAQIGYACNQVIFFGAGMISARFMWTQENGAPWKSARTWLELAALYLCIHATRTFVVLAFSPLLTRLGYGITWKEGFMLVWGGLRGAVGLAMGLIVEHHAYVDPQIAAKVAFHVSGIVLLTLLVNGTTIDTVYKRLEIYPPNPFHMNYLRKVLTTLEKSCLKASLQRMKGDWFFADVEFGAIHECVPQFSRIGFDTGGIPFPDDLAPVDDTLQGLFAPKKRRLQTTFEEEWHREKQESQNELWSLLRRSVELPADTKDFMSNVKNTGDERLIWPDREQDLSCPGLYLSTRPLSSLRHHWEDQEVASFSVKILQYEKCPVSIIVGLVKDTEQTLADAESNEVESAQLLGFTQNSVGINCRNGKVTYKGYQCEGDFLTDASSIEEGQAVSVEVSREIGSEWKIVLSLEREQRSSVTLGSLTLGPFGPGELYPAIEFMPLDIDNLSSHTSGITSGGLPRLNGSLSNTLHLNGALTAKHLGEAAKRKVGCKVSLSYELQNATENESMNQIFHSIFNMVAHQYRDMHEHCIVGQDALNWLLEAVGEALDCADHELHYKHATDFDIRDMEVQRPGTPSSMELRRVMSEQNLKHAKAADNLGITPMSYLNMFEPVVVSYLALEKFCSAASAFDHLPKSWHYVRRFGYGHFFSKVEALWAFVSAHQKMLRECAALEKHPQLVECIRGILDAALRDLKILQSLQPRRFFYSKHFLALHVIMTTRLEKLTHFTKEGWISREDSETLKEELYRRIRRVRHFIPPTDKAQARIQNVISQDWSTESSEASLRWDVHHHSDASARRSARRSSVTEVFSSWYSGRRNSASVKMSSRDASLKGWYDKSDRRSVNPQFGHHLSVTSVDSSDMQSLKKPSGQAWEASLTSTCPVEPFVQTPQTSEGYVRPKLAGHVASSSSTMSGKQASEKSSGIRDDDTPCVEDEAGSPVKLFSASGRLRPAPQPLESPKSPAPVRVQAH